MDKANEQHLKEYRKELTHLEYRIEAVTGLIAAMEEKEISDSVEFKRGKPQNA